MTPGDRKLVCFVLIWSSPTAPGFAGAMNLPSYNEATSVPPAKAAAVGRPQQQYQVSVPPGKLPGDYFDVNMGGEVVNAMVPNDFVPAEGATILISRGLQHSPDGAEFNEWVDLTADHDRAKYAYYRRHTGTLQEAVEKKFHAIDNPHDLTTLEAKYSHPAQGVAVGHTAGTAGAVVAGVAVGGVRPQQHGRAEMVHLEMEQQPAGEDNDSRLKSVDVVGVCCRVLCCILLILLLWWVLTNLSFDDTVSWIDHCTVGKRSEKRDGDDARTSQRCNFGGKCLPASATSDWMTGGFFYNKSQDTDANDGFSCPAGEACCSHMNGLGQCCGINATCNKRPQFSAMIMAPTCSPDGAKGGSAAEAGCGTDFPPDAAATAGPYLNRNGACCELPSAFGPLKNQGGCCGMLKRLECSGCRGASEGYFELQPDATRPGSFMKQVGVCNTTAARMWRQCNDTLFFLPVSILTDFNTSLSIPAQPTCFDVSAVWSLAGSNYSSAAVQEAISLPVWLSLLITGGGTGFGASASNPGHVTTTRAGILEVMINALVRDSVGVDSADVSYHAGSHSMQLRAVVCEDLASFAPTTPSDANTRASNVAALTFAKPAAYVVQVGTDQGAADAMGAAGSGASVVAAKSMVAALMNQCQGSYFDLSNDLSGPTYSLTLQTASCDHASTGGKVTVRFEVGGVYTAPQTVTPTQKGDIVEIKSPALASFPTAVKLELEGNNGWAFHKITLDGAVLQESLSLMTCPTESWLDSDDPLVSNSKILVVNPPLAFSVSDPSAAGLAEHLRSKLSRNSTAAITRDCAVNLPALSSLGELLVMEKATVSARQVEHTLVGSKLADLMPEYSIAGMEALFAANGLNVTVVADVNSDADEAVLDEHGNAKCYAELTFACAGHHSAGHGSCNRWHALGRAVAAVAVAIFVFY